MADDSRHPAPASPLDPSDWETFRASSHALLDACVDRLRDARRHPWQPVDEEARRALALGDAAQGSGIDVLARDLVDQVLPYATGNTHPRFFGWVHGTGLASGLLADIVASTMNSNCGGRDHGAVYVEREVMAWCRATFGFPDTASGVMVTGTSQATVIALAAARTRALGAGVREQGLRDAPRLTAYAGKGVHQAVRKAMELLGLGGRSLRAVATLPSGAMDTEVLARCIDADVKAGDVPFCVIGTAGSVDTGAFDDLRALADLCAKRSLWLHIDGAFGAWVKLAGHPWCDLVDGLDRADSIAFDFHKWMYVQYDCGAVLVRDGDAHRGAFAARPAYLAAQDAGLGGGEPWYCDYGVDLSRGFRALKVWAALRCHGSLALGQAIARNCELAELMAQHVVATDGLRLAAPVRSTICCFNAAPEHWSAERQGALNEAVAQRLQLDGSAVLSTTRVSDLTVLRAAITNHRTSEDDVRGCVADVAAARSHLLAAGSCAS